MASYNISSYSDLKTVKNDLAGDYTLTTDIDASDSETENARPGYPGEYYGFEPIGSNISPFTGTFDGGGYAISNLYINRGQGDGVDGESYCGLFGKASVASGTIHDLTISNANINGKGTVGILAGAINGTAGNKYVVSDCNVSGSVQAMSNGTSGGLAGWSVQSDFDDCTSSVSISGDNYLGPCGGFVGYSASSDFNNCTSGGTLVTSGTTSGTNNMGGFCGETYSSLCTFTSCSASFAIVDACITTASGISYLGGFVGYNGSGNCQYCYAAGSIISTNTNIVRAGGFGGYLSGTNSECAATGDLEITAATSSAFVAGFAGWGAGTISDCYARGDCCSTGIGSGTYTIGGFIGQSTASVTDSYSTGFVETTASKYGGFIGDRVSGSYTTCYWDTDTSGTTNGVEGGSYSGVTGHTTEDMKLEATYTGFDFDAIWDIPTYTQPAISQSNLTVWPSVSGDYENFQEGVNDDDSFVVVIPSTNEICWIESMEALIVGTAADEWKVASNKLNTPLSPTNFGVKRQSNYGSAYIQPCSVNEVILFIDFVGRKIREMIESAEFEKYVSNDMTSLAEHITESGIVCIAHQKNPDSMLWCVLSDGSLVSMVYNREQNVIAWSDHPVDGTVQSICVVPGTNEDEVWISVARTGGTYIEKMATRIQQDIENSYFVDSFIIDTGTSTTISGLDHLEGETVAALVDGVYDGTFTVSSGSITLSTTPVSQTIVGLPYTALLQPMRIAINGPAGSSIGSRTRINDLKVNFLNTEGAQYGSDTSSLYSFNFSDERLEDAAYVTGLFSGDIPVEMPGGFSMENPIYISSSQPFPMTVKAIIAAFEQTGR